MICDGEPLCSTFVFTIFVIDENSPVFAAFPTTSYDAFVAASSSITLPSYSDPLGLSVTLTTFVQGTSDLPSWATFTYPTYTLYPTDNTESGSYIIEAKICNTASLCSSLLFTIRVIGYPDFVTDLVDQTVEQGDTLVYTLPATTDPNGETTTITATLQNEKPLPAFISFDGLAFTLTPTSSTLPLKYKITVSIDDSLNVMLDYFTVQVTR